VDVGGRGRALVRQRTREGKSRGEVEVIEREKERAEGGRGGGFVLGMEGRSLRGGEKLVIHQGEDFST